MLAGLRTILLSSVASALLVVLGAGAALAVSPSARDSEQTKGGCGVERWTVKTLQDRPTLRSVHKSTVMALTRPPAPASLPDTRLPFERNVFRVVARVTLVHQEADSDYHLVLADQGRTMIAEAAQPAATPLGIARPYDLRHSYASLRFAESVNAAEIAEEMGNSLETMLSTYTHVIAELRGAGTVSAEALILEARSGHILVTWDEDMTASPSQNT